ncbi:porin [Limnohabitans sp. TS-CS-82]|uniref:porin n=1 Tax=Limnohabitans sp. TS-CS-82 TaxID=2094193 RepID=UPI0021011496|nr:porin [Limnohabitans sp. TS-CS-82]
MAALAAFGAQAQSTVGIKGTFDPSMTNQVTTYGNGNVRAVSGLFNSQQGTSQVTFFGTEDIGGGLKANFLIENDFNSTNDAKANWGSSTNTNIGQTASLGGETFVGLSGSMGDIKIGSPNSPSLDVTGRTPFGTKVGSGFGTSQGLSHVRENNQIVYTTPTFSGLTLKVASASKTTDLAVSNGTAAVARANSKSDIGLTYVNGPLKAMLVSYSQAAVHKQTHGYVAYTMGQLTATYGFGKDERLAAVTEAAATATAGRAAGKSSNYNVAVAYAMGATTLMANTGKLDDKTTDNWDIKMTAVGAKYDLSKRTSVYARYAKQTYDNSTNGFIAKEQKTTLVGLQHNF